MGIQITDSGLHTTIQDSGRSGYQRYGFSASGAMDQFSYRLANLLVGNKSNEAVLEMAVTGASFSFTQSNTIAITGSDCSPKLNGESVKMNQTFHVASGDELTTGLLTSGVFSYAAFSGGLQTPEVMQSRSTSTRYKIGGLNGRTLEAGDEIAFKAPVKKAKNNQSFYLPELDTVDNNEVVEIRLILASDSQFFTEEGVETFLESDYVVSSQSDRMGYRLKGPSVRAVNQQEGISEGTVLGDIQIPPDGQPIVLLADRQTTGGYPVIGTICTVDIPKIVQCNPGKTLRFCPITIEEAGKLLKKQEKLFKKLEKDRQNSELYENKQAEQYNESIEDWDTDKINSLIRTVDHSSLSLFQYEDASVRFKIDKRTQHIEKTVEKIQTEEQQEVTALEFSSLTIYSKLVGLFYNRLHSKGPPFVKEGERVKVGQTVGMIITLNIPYELTAEKDGIIRSILVEDDQIVQYGQPIIEMEIENNNH